MGSGVAGSVVRLSPLAPRTPPPQYRPLVRGGAEDEDARLVDQPAREEGAEADHQRGDEEEGEAETVGDQATERQGERGDRQGDAGDEVRGPALARRG